MSDSHPPLDREQYTRALDPSVKDFLNIEVVRTESAADVGQRGARATEYRLDEARDEDVLELEFQSGVTQWVSVSQLREDLGRPRSGENNGIIVPGVIPRRRPSSRGVADWVLKGLKLLRLDPVDPVADLAIDVLISQFETKLTRSPDLYRVSSSLEPLSTAKPDSLETSDPLLVFLHGTASNTHGSFGKLVSPEWERVAKGYGRRILGLEHHTLSVNPVRNALDLASQLPKGARLHLVTHSRGGLVGELLALAQVPEQAFDAFLSVGREPEVALLKELSALVKKKAFVIEKFVRVACPARGSLLASDRLDRYLSIILSLIGRIPVLQESVIYAFLKATAFEVARRRTKPDELPGIEAMMPTSLLVNLLNRPDVTSKADLAIVAGDIEGEGIFGTLKVFATDLFYRTDHDLVVNTASMYGGPKRETAAHFVFDRGGDVNHFSYFANQRTRTPLLTWLGGGDAGFAELTRGVATRTAPSTRGVSPATSPVVFLVPGMMASHLKVGSSRVWLDPTAIARGEFRKLKLGAGDRVTAEGLFADGYQRLIDFLQARLVVKQFPFDWRKSVFDAARQLARQVEAELAAHDKPVGFIGHSTGGLVVRAMIAERPDLWKRVRERRGRVVMLGAPNGGTWVVPRLLLGAERLVRQLALVDFAHKPSDLAGVFRTFTGLLEQLPADSDCFNVEWWRRLTNGHFTSFTPPDQRLLREARKSQERLRRPFDPVGVLYIAGRAPSTPCGISDGDEPEFLFTADGDGYVTDLSGRSGLRSWRVDTAHGDLADDPPAFPAILDLLETGTTSRLYEIAGRSEPSTQWPEGDDFEPLLYPTESELTASALGSRTGQAEAASLEIDSMAISVAHGDLRYANYPVLAGHYQGDTIVSAEAAIDRRLGGKLTERYRASLYPGPVGTAEVIHSPETSPRGALIVGLGEVGEITPEKVRRGVRAAALRHALMIAESAERVPSSGTTDTIWRSAAFSSLLLATVGGSSLSIESSVAAVIQGAVEANHALKAQGMWDRVRIDAIEFIELHEDLAIAAIRAACNLERLPPTELGENEHIEVVPRYLISREGRLFHRPANQYSTGWWRRIQITRANEESGGDLNFLTLTDRARAEDRLESTQRRLVDQLVASAIGSTSYDADLCATLYELLIPNLLKDQASIEANLALILDSEAAQYPWELLAERAYGRVEPFILRQGLIRQFKVSSFRQNPQGASERNVLVVGDTESGQAELTGAQEEAKIVAGVLGKAGFAVAGPLLRPDALTVVNELFARDYRILHLAGHGAYDQSKPNECGMLLGDGVFLTSKEIVKMRTVPDLVFLNCCHLARTDAPQRMLVERPDRLAASIAEELIKMGVKAIVAAGWAVDDQAASTFAETFYEAMLEGANFGDAVLSARQQTAKKHAGVNTWGAYQGYGNPAFTLTNLQRPGESATVFYSRREVLDQILNVTRAASYASASTRQRLKSELTGLIDAMPSFWIDGEVLSAIGDASGKLGDFNAAAEYYRKALIAPDGESTFKTAEQLVLLLLDEAHERSVESGQKAQRQIDRIHREARARLKWILDPGPTSSRLMLAGRLSKQLAVRTTGTARQDHLRRASEYYREAHALSTDSARVDAVDAARSEIQYATCRWLALRGARGAKSKAVREIRELLDHVESLPASREPVFAELRVRADVALLRRLIDQQLEKDWKEVGLKYLAASRAGASMAEMASIYEHLSFVSRMLEGSRGMKGTVAALELVKDELAKGQTR